MEIRTGSFRFPALSGSGPREDRVFFNFSQPVRQAVAGLAGTALGFSSPDDHHLGRVNVRLATAVDDDVVTVEAVFGVRDWSDNWDDDYEGTIQFVLLAELESGFLPSNLLVTGVEANQATQFFRSHLHLDPATARADNAIALVAGKNTILRVYVDTQNDPSRPTIATVSGRLEVRPTGSGAWIQVPPLNGPIAPIRDADIRRDDPDATLNFLIPGAFSVGQLDYRVRAFQPGRATQPGYFSGRFQDTLRFPEVEPLRVRGVGVNYTGMGLNFASPGVGDLRDTLDFIRQTYPVGRVVITGFDAIDFDGDLTDMSGDGCGDGWNDLLDRLREMQGDNSDVYYALVPSGVPFGWGGCGGGDGRVAAGSVGAEVTAAHEIAHAFDGRYWDHAPCGGAPNPDPNYPVYDALPSGSVGEIGITETGVVRLPSFRFDFMSHCSPTWVSPYTYEGLAGSFPSVIMKTLALEDQEGAEGPGQPSRGARPYLFLSFVIYRNGRVDVRPSFHYDAAPVLKGGAWTPYGVELRDCHDRVLHAQRVWLTDPHKDLDSAALSFFKPVPFDERAARLVFTCDGADPCARKELRSVDVPAEPPVIKIVAPGARRLSGRVRVAWEPAQADRCLYYLVRYSNDDGRTWRALAPRLTATELEVDLGRLPGGDRCRFQVLASEGIRTGAAVSGPFVVRPRPAVPQIVDLPPGAQVLPDRPVRLAGDAYSPDTGSVDPRLLRWESDRQGTLGYGAVIFPRLRAGIHRVSLTVEGDGARRRTASIDVDVRWPPARGHTSREDPRHTSRDHARDQGYEDAEGGAQHGD